MIGKAPMLLSIFEGQNINDVSFVEQIKQLLFENYGTALIHKFPDFQTNQRLIKFSQQLGTIIVSGSPSANNPLEDGLVYCVEQKNVGKGVKDENNLVIFSTTSDVFPCHTDGYCNNPSADILLLLCVRPSEYGGETLLAHLDQILLHLSPEELLLLKKPIFPTAYGCVPILYEENGELFIRFNKREIDRFSKILNITLPREPQHTIEHLETLVSLPSLQHRFRLETGDCLVLNNRKVLHGRTNFPDQSDRLLKRVWISH